MKRREFLKTTGFSLLGMAAICLGCGSSTAAPAANAATTNITTKGANATMNKTNAKKVLVAYFSWSGNTRALAQEIQKQTGGDLYEIVPATAYPTVYKATTDQAKQEQQAGARPAIKNNLPNVADYDVICLGYPNWWGSFPMPVATFVEKVNLQGKTIAPFFTHGGGGVQRCQSDLAKLAPNANFTDYLCLSGNSARSASGDVAQWLRKLGL
ncbi:MAG: flavodoxin [Phascolarctobacterium sp.]|uniref:flavodoxin n=1 Tax=Phascolarctobacterium sp. TaxID=2049039 RepID=UPI0026DCA682|nr:flavodoxin [Phascolarctobacterium sp.]MDO4920647.1 flavodoxin [Phascolarctobacterium sp.]